MEDNKELAKLKFNLTEEMNNTMIELLLIKQMLKEGKIGHEEELIEQIDYLKEKFKKLFVENNQKQIKEYMRITNQ